MLRHLGVTRRQILGQFAIEGLLVTVLGIVSGLAVGFAVALVLIHVVNPQSFHWTMELHVPAGLIALLVAALLATATLTALLAVDARLRIIPRLSESNLRALAWHIVPVTLIAVLFVITGVGFRFGWLS